VILKLTNLARFFSSSCRKLSSVTDNIPMGAHRIDGVEEEVH